MGQFDEAAILTNDTDLVEAVRIVTREVGLPVTLLTPENKPAGGLVKVASHVRHFRDYLGACQFPPSVTLSTGRIVQKIPHW
jgi:uncharacterized LabA/DUF88 family protein